jgi:adenine-specific DNA glycosylase
VLSIAYDLPEPLVDGNVARVLARWFLVEDDPRAGERPEEAVGSRAATRARGTAERATGTRR